MTQSASAIHLINPNYGIYNLILDKYNLNKEETVIFDDKEKAEKSALELKTLAKDIAVTKPVNKGCKIIK